MDGWTTDLPRIPGHYWIAIPPFEKSPDIEHVELMRGALMVRDDQVGEWRPIADVWGNVAAHWWGPLMPPEIDGAALGDDSIGS